MITIHPGLLKKWSCYQIERSKRIINTKLKEQDREKVINTRSILIFDMITAFICDESHLSSCLHLIFVIRGNFEEYGIIR